MPPTTRESLRALQLPILLDHESQVANAITAEVVQALHVPDDDIGAWLELQHAKWREDNELNGVFEDAIKKGIRAGHPEFGAQIADAYFKMHQELRADYFLPHNKATAFLSHALLMIRLAREDLMSAAQVARIMSALDKKAEFSRQSADAILRRLNAKPDLIQDDVEILFEQDKALSESSFADADIYASADFVGSIACSLGVEVAYGELLKIFYNEMSGQALTPYIQMLHYQCILIEFFDHTPLDIYEFKPRGRIVDWLLEQYPDAIVSAGNPFLNNAKSVESLDISWVRSKKKADRPGANALFRLIEALDSLGFAARQELSAWTRRWILRLFSYVESTAAVEVPVLSSMNVEQLLQSVISRESNTLGIIEQRLLDAVSQNRHNDGQWVARGLGDSVNSTNLSKRKLGDIDYQNIHTHTVCAYEAHAGRLTKVYLAGHLRTLGRSLALRRQEWEAVSPPNDWSVRIVFVAHDFEERQNSQIEIQGNRVEIVMATYEEFLNGVLAANIVDQINQFVVNPLNERRTPVWVRQKMLSIIGN